MRTLTTSHLPAEPGYVASDFGLDDRNDCAVRAFANVGVDTYPNVRDALFRMGRRQYKGTKVTTTSELARLHGGVYTAMGRSGAKRERIMKYYNCGADAVNDKGCTVAKVSERFPKGRHIVSVKGHVFALINGQIIDTGPVRPGTRVIGIYSFPNT
jgi:hypothetical protein